MIRSAFLICLALSGVAWAESDEESSEETDPLSPYRLPFSQLAEHTLGTASKSTIYSWRRSKVQVAATGGLFAELNNFSSARAGLMVRAPSKKMITEFNLSYAKVWDTPSSRMLALTPYRQLGRPRRFELDLTVAYPLAEGVITAAPRFFPSVQIVFNGYVSLRYRVYPGGFGDMRRRDVFKAILSPRLTVAELDNLDAQRLDAMEVDPARFGPMFGLGNDLYFEKGFFVSPRVMMALPLFSVQGRGLRSWSEFNLAVGLAF